MRTHGIANILEKEQEKMIWNEEFISVGASAFASSYDLWNARTFVQKNKEQIQPTGYLLGIGCDTILSLLAFYPKEVLPKGIILVDVDPAVVACAKILVYCIKRCPARLDFLSLCYGEKNLFENLQTAIVNQESNPYVKKQIEIHSERLKKEWFLHFRFSPESVLARQLPYWMGEGYARLHQLAKENNIAILHADFFNPTLLQIIQALPGFQNSSHVIYLANATDHFYRKKDDSLTKEQFVKYLNAKILSELSILKVQEPNKVLFVDTTQSARYALRCHKEVPYFTLLDFPQAIKEERKC